MIDISTFILTIQMNLSLIILGVQKRNYIFGIYRLSKYH